jgi:chorismate mutase
MKIDGWRRKIDQIDTALLHLLNLRAELALEAGRVKDEEGVSLRVPEREAEFLKRMRESNPGPLDEDAIARIYQLILAESVRAQERVSLAKINSAKPAPETARGNQRKPGRRWR